MEKGICWVESLDSRCLIYLKKGWMENCCRHMDLDWLDLMTIKCYTLWLMMTNALW